jgi:hypothetical protein
MSANESTTEKEKDVIMFFYGKDIHSKTSKKRLNQKISFSLAKVVLMNAAIIIGLILIISLLVNTIKF